MTTNGQHRTVETKDGRTLPFGASQVGVFELVPRLGYREYWYPAIESKMVKRKPVTLKMLGDDLVFFRDTNGKVAALTDYCPHRGARLSGGFRRTPGGGPIPGKLNDEFKGYITCPYHGFVFDGSGQCVAALTEGPDSKLPPKLRARHYPTRELFGIVFVWMGETEPVPIEEDIPWYFFDDDVIVETYVRRWDMNWSLTIENSHDSHAVKIHRGNSRRLWNLNLFRKSPAYHGHMRISEEGDNYIYIVSTAEAKAPVTAYYDNLKKNWPQKTWFRFRTTRRTGGSTKKPKQFDPHRPGYTGVYRLPAWVSPSGSGDRSHLRCAVPVTENVVRMWTVTLTRKSFWPGLKRFWWKVVYHASHVYQLPQGTNEFEDMPVQSVGCLDPDRPQKIGATDVGLIFWRRRMPLKSRDAQRVWGTKKVAATAAEIKTAEEREAAEAL
ncbi:MAG: Rieske 2Fe-2S domain-containing protein [SAR202 cluster bacterium]|nr:Rieske 2Fe-2S domain-containing protein [SAR202 cluster bacterium]